MVIFIELVQYAKYLGGKSRKNLVEHQIIKMIRKFNSTICRFFAPHSQDNAFSLLHGPIPIYYSQTCAIADKSIYNISHLGTGQTMACVDTTERCTGVP